MKYIPVTNNTNMPIYVGAQMVPAHDTRHFPEDQVPMHLRPVEEPIVEAVVSPLLTLLALSLKEIELAAYTLSDADLQALKAAELERENPRKGLGTLVDEMLLERASLREQASVTLQMPEAELVAMLDAASKDELIAAREVELSGQNRPGVIAAIDASLEKLTAAAG